MRTILHIIFNSHCPKLALLFYWLLSPSLIYPTHITSIFHSTAVHRSIDSYPNLYSYSYIYICFVFMNIFVHGWVSLVPVLVIWWTECDFCFSSPNTYCGLPHRSYTSRLAQTNTFSWPDSSVLYNFCCHWDWSRSDDCPYASDRIS